MNTSDKKSFVKARKVAKSSDFHAFHTGCVLTYKNKVIGTGYNSVKTHPDQMIHNRFRDLNYNFCNHSLHAEIKAFNSVKYTTSKSIDWRKVKVYVYRICNSRKCGIARPCPACMAKIKEMGIKHIYYTTDDGYAHEIIT